MRGAPASSAAMAPSGQNVLHTHTQRLQRSASITGRMVRHSPVRTMTLVAEAWTSGAERPTSSSGRSIQSGRSCAPAAKAGPSLTQPARSSKRS